MDENLVEQSLTDILANIPDMEDRQHIVILHEKFCKRSIDRYIVNIALIIEKMGYKVTLYTTNFNMHNCIEDLTFLRKIYVKLIGWWIPQTIFGFFEDKIAWIKAIWLALRMTIIPKSQKPVLIVLDTHSIALYILRIFTSYNVIYIENFHNLNKQDTATSLVLPSLLQAKCIKYANEIIVESCENADIFKKIFPSIVKEPTIIYPSVDMGMWLQPGINIQRFIPDLMENAIIFVTIGKYYRTSKFQLAVDAFEMLIDLFDDKPLTKRFQLIIAGYCKTSEEKSYYEELLQTTKQRKCATQVTFLKHLPVVHEKTLLMESTIVLHPAKNDVNCEFLLRAMYLGKPIVATNRGIASKLLIHRLSGIIIDEDARLFAIALKKLMISTRLQHFLGDMAKETFQKHYSFESQSDRMRKIIQKYVKKEQVPKQIQQIHE